MPSDMSLAGILGTAPAITGGMEVNAAVAIAVPLGLLGSIVWVSRMTIILGNAVIGGLTGIL